MRLISLFFISLFLLTSPAPAELRHVVAAGRLMLRSDPPTQRAGLWSVGSPIDIIETGERLTILDERTIQLLIGQDQHWVLVFREQAPAGQPDRGWIYVDSGYLK